MQRKIRESPLR